MNLQLSIIIYIFVISLIVYIVYLLKQKHYDKFTNYSSIDDDISNGNSISWSKTMNPIYPYKTSIKYNNNYIKDNINKLVIQGHGVPLSYEEELFPSVDRSMFYFNNFLASPECCPSVYSSDKGCVCWKPN